MNNSNTKKNVVIIVAGICLVVMCLLFLGCCSLSTGRSLEDVTPTQFGESEGLYLYKGDTRSLTDGTQSETLFDVVEIDGVEYTRDDFTVRYYIYSKVEYKIFFILALQKDEATLYHIYLYDYQLNVGEIIYSAQPDSRGIGIRASDYYVYAEIYAETYIGLLFAHDGTLLCDSIESGTLESDVLSRRDLDNLNFTWYKDGVVHTVTSAVALGNYQRFGDFAYFFCDEGLLAIDLNTGEHTLLFKQRDFRKNCVDGKCLYIDGELYALSMGLYSSYHLHKIVGRSAETVHEFENVRAEILMTVVDDKMYFNDTKAGCAGVVYYTYDTENEKLERVGSRPKSSATPDRSTKSQILEVGDYTFYVDYISYDVPGSFTEGSRYGETSLCYYLYRDDGTKTEVMQYSLESRAFYDNICPF